jgi:2-oxoglutarate dehydrogenase E1 component
MASWQEFSGLNRGYVLELYEKYRNDPASVDADTRALFEQWIPPADDELDMSAGQPVLKSVGAVNLVQSIRRYGHLAAQLDPLGSRPLGDPSLLPETHGVTNEDLRTLPASLIWSGLAENAANMYEVAEAFRHVYCSTSGYDFAHVFVPEERRWLRQAVESGRFRSPADPIDPTVLLDRLSQVEAFERFLHRTFPGKTRFSIEGLDMLVPVLDEIIGDSAEFGVRHILIGMAHRGRLNVMAHVLNKPYAQILAEFKDPVSGRSFREDMAWTGDVKYHAGARRALKGGAEMDVFVAMPPNPSHLEAVDPVVLGMARAAGTLVGDPGPAKFEPTCSLPILIHGDAAFPGQGVVAETLNLSRLQGYSTGGTIHIIVNNQLGFTTVAEDAYSTSYASGLARGFKIPIIHVNADDPEACVEAARLAIAYRKQFQRDFLIDLIGYRRHGHNEGDEPAFTQPLMYQRISAHPTVREIWARTLVERGVIAAGTAEELSSRALSALQQTMETLKPEHYIEPEPEAPPAGAASNAATAVPLERLRELNASLVRLPDGFAIHRKLERVREKRPAILDNVDEATVDWAAAEELALASILADGISIRLTGEDAERGTFSHRHAAFHDVNTGAVHIPLQQIPQARAAFEIHNSPLTENALIGFEFGYNIQEPSRLVIWEAQYGDFINGAQTMIDEFLVSARGKWGLHPSLVLLLPHGHEGQGPDHASARPERFLQLAADINIRIANCTTAAQYFHLLRRQAALLTVDPLPLVVLTPKSLLRHAMVASAPSALAEGRFRMVIPDGDAVERLQEIRRVLVCSGKIYVDLMTSAHRAQRTDVAICRLEQLYPVPMRDLRGALEAYSNAEEVVWVQEEPENMGAWEFIRPHLTELAGGRTVRRVARPRSASPAEGSAARHATNQQALVDRAFGAPAGSDGKVAQKARQDAALSSAKG